MIEPYEIDRILGKRLPEGNTYIPHIVAYQNLDLDWDEVFSRVAPSQWLITGEPSHCILRVIYGDDYLDATEVVNLPYWEDRDVGGGVFAAANECMQHRCEKPGRWEYGRGDRTTIPLEPRIKLENLLYDYLRSINKKLSI